MDGEKLDVGEIMQRVGLILRLSTGAALLYSGVLSAAAIAADLTDPEGGGSTLLVNILSIAAGLTRPLGSVLLSA